MTVEQANHQIARKIDLKALSREQARIEIARDVLAWMDLKKIRITRGNYFLASLPGEAPSKPVDLREAFHEFDSCQVCAIGACFVAVVARVNGFSLDVDDSSEIIIDDDSMLDKLAPYFSKQELSRLESMFELSVIDYRDEDESTCMEFVAWGQRIGREDSFNETRVTTEEARNTRIRALMYRIISTDGVAPITVPEYEGRTKDLESIKAWRKSLDSGVEITPYFNARPDAKDKDEEDDDDDLNNDEE